MIIFYNKKTGDIFGMVEGRVHDNEELMLIQPKDIPVEDIGKYVVPFVPVEGEREIPDIRKFINKKTGEITEKQVGVIKEKAVVGLTIDSPHKDLFYEFEKKSKDIYKYKVAIGKNGEVAGFIKK